MNSPAPASTRPMVWTPPSRRGEISNANCNEGGCHADRSNRPGSSEIRLRGSRCRLPRKSRRAQNVTPRCGSPFFANLPRCLVGMEASNGAHYWARVLSHLDHEVRLISPQFVTPYVKSNKNDRNDAEAICEAVGRPTMRFVPPKSADHLAIQAVHRIRSRLVADRVKLVNQVRGLLAEHGVVIARDIPRLRRALAEITGAATMVSMNWCGC